jgi:hypothetical protein
MSLALDEPALCEGPTPMLKRDDLLTRKEASDFLLTLGVKLKPSTLARLWSTGGNGPPCVHHRNRPRYPREVLRAWAAEQTTVLRRSRRASSVTGSGGSHLHASHAGLVDHHTPRAADELSGKFP